MLPSYVWPNRPSATIWDCFIYSSNRNQQQQTISANSSEVENHRCGEEGDAERNDVWKVRNIGITYPIFYRIHPTTLREV